VCTTKKDINKLIEILQAIYANGLLARRDALFDLVEALLSAGLVASFAMLSLTDQFRRKWPSLNAAVEDGVLDSHWLWCFLGQQVHPQGI